MSVLSNRDPTVILTDYTNWANGTNNYKRNAPHTKCGKAPLIGSYQPSTAATNLHVTQYRQAIGDDSAEAPAYVPVRPSDLATNAKTSYKEDIC
ncbi:hypothetical protein A1F94_005098 [Pyrenophora tritici-repentis]|nr:hypothetical protein A1F94_005098 [Pyrenophora tritici-repentis]